jgi:hypothetical protein
MILLRTCILWIVVLTWIATTAYGQDCLKPRNSVLANIDCGRGRATCRVQKTAISGTARCTCSATCLSPRSITSSIAATRGVQWGANQPCSAPLIGYAEGGTTTTNNPSTATAVYAYAELQGEYVGNPSSRQTVDCFQGVVDDEELITGVC